MTPFSAFATVSASVLSPQTSRELRPGCAEVVALSLLVLGDEQTRAQVQSAPAITIDGCKLACASKMVAESGGQVAYEANVLDTFRRHRHLKPKGIAELNEEGQELARQMALELAEAADKIVGEQEVKDA